MMEKVKDYHCDKIKIFRLLNFNDKGWTSSHNTVYKSKLLVSLTQGSYKITRQNNPHLY